MKTQTRLLTATTVVMICVFSIGAYLYKQKERKTADLKIKEHLELLVRSHSPSLGPDNAPVTMVEFLDPECEACGAIYPVVKTVLKEFPNKVRYVVRYVPFHQNSMYAASVLEATRMRGKYWQCLETLFARQPEWASHDNPRPELIMKYIKELGMDPDEIKRSLKDSVYEQRVRQDHADARLLGVTQTPTFFINGKRLEDLTYESMKAAILAAMN